MFQMGCTAYQVNHLPMHSHKVYEITAYYHGSGTVYTTAGDIPVMAGMITIMPPGILHQAVSSCDLESIHISGDFRGVFHLEKPVLITDNAEGEGQQLLWMLYRNRSAGGDYVSALCNAMAHFLLQNLAAEDAISQTVRKIVGEITDNYHNSNLSLHALLNRSGYAEDYIRAHFKRITGKTPTMFLHNLRVKQACYLIEVYRNTMSLSEIAAQCGYTDYVFFSKKFRSITGVSPREYKSTLQT
ncbi:MAG: helix-turn-helix transcriptional regulator [Ruminococcaceae bacterium]|nr:helix-turn-helix transcriptional regulator [Oscillospiraceae bacterium]